MNGMHRTGSAVPLSSLPYLLLVAVIALAGCGTQATVPPASSPGVPTATTGSGPEALPITRGDPGGTVVGLVVPRPVSLDEAAALASDLDGDLVALWRTDYVLVKPKAFLTTSPVPPEPSRFTYMDPQRMYDAYGAAINAGLVEPTSAVWTISPSEHNTEQWTRAQEPGVRFEALAVYLAESDLDDVKRDARFRAVVSVPYYPVVRGVLFVQSEDFPPGFLTEAPLPTGTSAPDTDTAPTAVSP